MNDDKIVPVEIELIKVITPSEERESSQQKAEEDVKEYIRNKIDAIKEAEADRGNAPEAVLFRAYGWFDFLAIIARPRTRCLIKQREREPLNFPLMRTSLMGWYYENGIGNVIENRNRNKTPYFKLLEGIHSKLSKPENMGGEERVVWKDFKCVKGIYYPGKEDLHILSFIKLNEAFQSNTQNSQNVQRSKQNSKILECFMIIDCLGTWDVAILARVSKSGGYENVEKYKNDFLVSTPEISQSSSILLSPFKEGGEK